MDRRTVLVALGMTATGGCTSYGTPHNDTSENEETPFYFETPTEEPTEETTERNRPWYLLAQWVEESSPDVTPHPSDEPPVSNFDGVLELFDKAADEPESETHDEPEPATRFGESSSTEITEEKKDEIKREFADIEEYKSSSRDGYYPAGWYIEHDETIFTLDLARPD